MYYSILLDVVMEVDEALDDVVQENAVKYFLDGKCPDCECPLKIKIMRPPVSVDGELLESVDGAPDIINISRKNSLKFDYFNFQSSYLYF